MKKYRLYIDESGTHSYKRLGSIKERYIALIGIIISKSHNESFITPKIEELRDIFVIDVDFKPIFHYTDIVSKRLWFNKLNDADIEKDFNQKYLTLFRDGDYKICCVVLDKKTHKDKYGSSAMYPYHYCLNVLLERYVRFLEGKSARGDVIAEARGKKEDRLLKSEFERFYQNGTHQLKSVVVQKYITSPNLKIKTKESRIAGLEMADLLATPMKFLTLKHYKVINKLSDNFSRKVLLVAKNKIRTSPNGSRVTGYGIKFIQ